MSNLAVIEREGQRVLTTQQLAELYSTETKTINKNYERNKDKYIEGKHYFSLSGDALKDFKGLRQNDDTLKFVSVLYLWTERGALLHAKSLNTNKAWEVYDILVETYFNVHQKQLNLPQTLPEALRAYADEVEKREVAEKQIKLLVPKAEFFDQVAESKDAIPIGDAAKVLNMGIGRNTLFQFLRDNGVLMQNNVPYQKYIDQGYFRVIEQKWVTPEGETKINIKSLVYQKGLEYIRRQLIKVASNIEVAVCK